MGRMAITPCCGAVAEPGNKTTRAEYRSLLRMGICPLCKLDLTKPINGDSTEQAHAKLWFRTNAYMPGRGSRIWQWSDDECALWREVMARFPDEEIDPAWPKWVALEPYVGSLAILVPLDDSATVLDIKRVGGFYHDFGSWRITLPVPKDLIEKLRERGYVILPSVELAEAYGARWTA